MFIPSYRIHNILKDFTLQLKKNHQSTRPLADDQETSPEGTKRPNSLRLETVINKVAANIMDRIAVLGKEATHHPPTESERPSATPDGGFNHPPPVFDYHLMDREKGKLKQRLVVEDSQILVQRFQTLTATDENLEDDEH